MAIAADLFYHQGYRATGINEVIDRSGVAKATFYNHFPSKDDLGLAYLKQVKEQENAHIETFIRAAEGPLNRFLAVMRSLEPWLKETDYRGCGFINMAAEMPDPESKLRRIGRELYDEITQRVEELAQELIASDKKKYGHLDARVLCNEYMVAFTGAIALAELYHAVWPVEHALGTVMRLISHK